MKVNQFGQNSTVVYREKLFRMNPEFSGSRSQFKDYENVLIVKKTFYECLVRPSSIHH